MRPGVVKILVTLSVMVLLAGLVNPQLNQLLFHNPVLMAMEARSEASINQGLLRAATAYGVGRGINAVVSVIQESGVNVAVASLALGQVLDPLNDVVERFSDVAMLAMASLGVQKILVRLGPGVGQYLFLPLALAALMAAVWITRWLRPVLIRWSAKMLLLFLIFQFGMPAVALTTHLVYATLLQAQYERALKDLGNEQAVLAGDQVTPAEPSGWWDRVKQTLSLQEMRDRVDRLKNRTGQIVEDCLDLSVIFIVHTLLLPVGLLWLLLKLVGWILRADPTAVLRRSPVPWSEDRNRPLPARTG